MSHNATSGHHDCVVMFFVLSVEAKELKKCRSLLNCDSALSASTREPTLHTLAPTLNFWKSFLLLFTFQLNSHCFLFHLPPVLTFTLKLLVYIVKVLRLKLHIKD